MIYKSLQFVGTDWQTDRRMNAIQGVLLGLKNICSGYTLWILGDFITDIWTMQTTYKPVSIFWEIFKLENNYQQACDMSNVSSISSIDDCAYYYSSLTAMFCPAILAVLIAFGDLVFQAVRKQKNANHWKRGRCSFDWPFLPHLPSFIQYQPWLQVNIHR